MIAMRMHETHSFHFSLFLFNNLILTSELIILSVIVEFIQNLFLKMRDGANPEVVVKTETLLTVPFKTS